MWFRVSAHGWGLIPGAAATKVPEEKSADAATKVPEQKSAEATASGDHDVDAEDDGGDMQEHGEEEVPEETDMCVEDGKKPAAGEAEDAD